MYKKSIAITAILAASILSVIAISTPFAYASTESETETEQELKQRTLEVVIQSITTVVRT